MKIYSDFKTLDRRHQKSKTVIRDFVSTRLDVHKHVKISVGEWILEITRPCKQVPIFEIYFVSISKFFMYKRG